jgi:hypothetical protein
MNEQVMRNWITTLRMGGYRQCRGTLYRVVGSTKYFCAVGVLLEMCDPTGWRDHTDYAWSQSLWQKSEAYMTRALGFPADVIQNVIRMNDHHHMSFGEIADHLEGYLGVHSRFPQICRPVWKDALVTDYNQKKALEHS